MTFFGYNFSIPLIRSALDRVTARKCLGWGTISAQIQGGTGLEIGGPTEIFKKNRLIPIYPIVKRIDHCNFSENTVWGSTAGGSADAKGWVEGKQFVSEGVSLPEIGDSEYDFVAASHVLEHIANPLMALHEWKRIVRPGGVLLVIVPDQEGTFDHRRPVTTMEHILRDYEEAVTEEDTTHLGEILRLHDLKLDPGAGSYEEFRARSLRNSGNRCLHHHVFDAELLREMFAGMELQVVHQGWEPPWHIVFMSRKA
jgi:SAM-dependent methyltransferase